VRYEIKRSNEEIDDLLNQCAEAEDRGDSRFFGMTYEQGIKCALEWVLGELEEYPLPEE
jgi:hypothetical protein